MEHGALVAAKDLHLNLVFTSGADRDGPDQGTRWRLALGKQTQLRKELRTKYNLAALPKLLGRSPASSLEVGEAAPRPFEHRSYADELHKV